MLYVDPITDDTEDIVQRNESEWYVNGQCPFHKFLLQFNITIIFSTCQYRVLKKEKNKFLHKVIDTYVYNSVEKINTKKVEKW